MPTLVAPDPPDAPPAVPPVPPQPTPPPVQREPDREIPIELPGQPHAPERVEEQPAQHAACA
jgi:hypothetical protein